MQRTGANRSVADKISASGLQAANVDLDRLFARLSNENLTITYDTFGKLQSVVDNENSITITLDWNDWNDVIPKLYIQEAGDPKKYTVTYSGLGGTIQSVIYA